MKKLVYFFGIFALIAGLVTSCSKDDDDEGKGEGNTVVQRKLVKVIFGDDDWYEFKYDNEGRCISETVYNDNQKDGYTLYKYESDKIICDEYEEDDTHFGTATIRLNPNGFIESWELIIDEASHVIASKYYYDNQGQLISVYSMEGDDRNSWTYNYEWKDGNIVKETKRDEVIIYDYTNSVHTSLLKNNTNFSFEYMTDPICYNMGMPCKNLPVSKKEGEEETFYEWTMDGDGYPIKLTNKYSDGEVVTTEYIWE